MITERKLLFIGWGVAIFLFVLLLQRCGCEKCADVVTSVEVKKEKFYDTVPKEIKVPYAVKGDSVKVEVPADVDTALILQKYFNQYYYSQTIADSNIRATIKDSVTKNRISYRKFTYQLLKPTQLITTINKPVEIPAEKMALYPGIFAGTTTIGDKVGLGIELMLLTKKKTIYRVGYDLLQKRIEAGAAIQIRFGKK